MRRKISFFFKDLGIYTGLWFGFLFSKLYRGFAHFEGVKKAIATVLYRQRGRFARPFVHTAMGGLVAMAVTLAPVLANSFPGITDEAVAEELPEIAVMEAVEGGTVTVESDRVRDKVLEYQVQSGDTISAIAQKFGVSVETIMWENNLASQNSIKPGQNLKILPVTGIKHKVARGETIYTIAKKYEANAQAIVDFPFNVFADDENFSLAVGQELIVPDGKKPASVPSATRYVAQRTPDAGVVSATGQFVWPIGGVITQRFSWYHRAIDVATKIGTPIVAADSGRVIVAGWPDNSGYGNRVMIDHNNGFITLYAHLSRVDVVVGQNVNRGDRIGLEGSTGRSTGPHLHFEIRKGSIFLNPLQYLK